MSIFELTETSYVEAVWFVSWKDADWMALVYRDDADAPWRATYRFRYHAAGDRSDPFDNRDKKTAVDVRAKDGSDEWRVRIVNLVSTMPNASV